MTLARVAQVSAAWGVLFAVVHAYWAAGGEAGMNGEPADTLGVQLYIAFIAVLGLVGAAVARGLVRDSGARLRHRTRILLARAAGAALLLGVAFGTGSWLVEWSLEGDGAAGVVITLYFLLGGLLFSALGWHSFSDGSRGNEYAEHQKQITAWHFWIPANGIISAAPRSPLALVATAQVTLGRP